MRVKVTGNGESVTLTTNQHANDSSSVNITVNPTIKVTPN